MIYYKEFKEYEIKVSGKRKKIDQNIYTFDIETTSFIELNDKYYSGLLYDKLSEDEKKLSIPHSTMYIWQFSINDTVYYGRTWEQFREFIKMIDDYNPNKKIIFVHNLAFEFQYIYPVLQFDKVFARKSHKVISAECKNYNIEFRCSYMMSNCSLEKLPQVYNLPVKKLVGNLDYTQIRHSDTPLTEEELSYCENDCLVVYEYIKFELQTYKEISKLPKTSTGHVRRELRDLTINDYKYKNRVRKAVNVDPHIYNLLVNAFMGGYTHSSYTFTDEIIKDVDSWDITSSYPYVMTSYKFPSTQFKRVYIKSVSDMSKHYAYLMVVNFKNVKCKYYNTFISSSKCMNLKGAKYDNGRIIEAKEFSMILTDLDFRFYLDTYDLEYEIVEAYSSLYSYLPKQLIEFILDKYVKKTEYKGIEEKALEYALEKAKFNAIFGMSVTNNISDKVEFDDNIWNEVPLTNEEIIKKLIEERKKGFLSFAYGVWITAIARNNLLRRVVALDEYILYCDTDSMKLRKGYNKQVILDYNKRVEDRIRYVSDKLGIDFNRYSPKDKHGEEHLLGIFTYEGRYKEFITQGAKKYAVKEINKDGEEEIKITVAGVPKRGAKALKDLSEFKDGLIFKYEDTKKNLLFYVDNQEECILEDYLGNKRKITDYSGCCLLPNSYTLGKALDYAHLISDESAKRSLYKE